MLTTQGVELYFQGIFPGRISLKTTCEGEERGSALCAFVFVGKFQEVGVRK
jgi:hypothetical protein